jgi:hypothetical protein
MFEVSGVVGFGTHEIVWGCVAEEVGYGYLRADFTPVGTTKIRIFSKFLENSKNLSNYYF